MTYATRQEELAAIYWDFYKEVYNVRPRWVDFAALNEDDLTEMLNRLDVEAKEVFAREKEYEIARAAKFEKLVAKTMTNGAKTREDALRWIMQASTCDGDWDFLAFEHGLPYNYFK